MHSKVESTVGNGLLSIESGHLAKQADGAVIVRYGDTVVMVTVVASSDVREGIDFFPMSVDYREKTSAVGKYPGGFIKRETRPTTKEILTMRLIDRPLRPLFPKNYLNEVQIMASVLSADENVDPDILALVGASAAVTISPLPLQEIVGAVRVGRVNGEFIINPTYAEVDEGDLNLVVAGTEDSVLMVEACGNEVKEEDVIDAIMFAQGTIKDIVKMQKELQAKCGKEKLVVTPAEENESLYNDLKARFYTTVKEKSQTRGKFEQKNALSALRKEIVTEYCDKERGDEISAGEIKEVFEKLKNEAARDLILNDGTRLDGRELDGIRPITCDVGLLPRTHGSAVFTRGETQALVVTTLGTGEDGQRVDGLREQFTKKFMLDYNFPPFCVGETKPVRGPGRREIGHGNLAERAITAALPSDDVFPYTIRLVSDILESNGSSSMATICGGTLSLMDAGVPISDPVAGIAMGLVKDGENVCILSDITGTEDHFGDMDFKVAGTQNGITALQMDIKIAGITRETMEKALNQAKAGRMIILQEILKALNKPRGVLSDYAPRLTQVKINPDKIGTLIGPGGKMIKKIQEETGARIEIDDNGTVTISSTDGESAAAATAMVERVTEDVQIGKVYAGRVTSVKDFGAFVEILPGQEGLVHISELSNDYVDKVEDIVKIDQEMPVKVLNIDGQKKIRLSAKAVAAQV